MITRKIASGAAAATIAVASLLGLGIATIGHAGASPARHHHVHCTTKHGKPYPPGKCFIVFNEGKYTPGDHVKFQAKTFNGGQRVRVHLRCHSLHKHVLTTHANGNGTVSGGFDFPKHAPKGTCTLRVHGGGSDVSGNTKATH